MKDDEWAREMHELLNMTHEPHCDLHEKPVIMCEINLVGGDTIRFLATDDPDQMQNYLGRMVTELKVLQVTGHDGVRHLIRTHRVNHVKVRVMVDGKETGSQTPNGGGPEESL